jgi:hypothetical protein
VRGGRHRQAAQRLHRAAAGGLRAGPAGWDGGCGCGLWLWAVAVGCGCGLGLGAVAVGWGWGLGLGAGAGAGACLVGSRWRGRAGAAGARLPGRVPRQSWAALHDCTPSWSLPAIARLPRLSSACLCTPAFAQGDDISTTSPYQGEPSHRVHCSLNLNTDTGRLSARRPNLQNQPALEKDRWGAGLGLVLQLGPLCSCAGAGAVLALRQEPPFSRLGGTRGALPLQQLASACRLPSTPTRHTTHATHPPPHPHRYQVRRAFRAEAGKTLVVADYGQLELRILAHVANCKWVPPPRRRGLPALPTCRPAPNEREASVRADLACPPARCLLRSMQPLAVCSHGNASLTAACTQRPPHPPPPPPPPPACQVHDRGV